MANSRTTANSNKDNKDMKLSSESSSENIVSGAILEQLERQETRIKTSIQCLGRTKYRLIT